MLFCRYMWHKLTKVVGRLAILKAHKPYLPLVLSFTLVQHWVSILEEHTICLSHRVPPRKISPEVGAGNLVTREFKCVPDAFGSHLTKGMKFENPVSHSVDQDSRFVNLERETWKGTGRNVQGKRSCWLWIGRFGKNVRPSKPLRRAQYCGILIISWDTSITCTEYWAHKPVCVVRRINLIWEEAAQRRLLINARQHVQMRGGCFLLHDCFSPACDGSLRDTDYIPSSSKGKERGHPFSECHFLRRKTEKSFVGRSNVRQYAWYQLSSHRHLWPDIVVSWRTCWSKNRNFVECKCLALFRVRPIRSLRLRVCCAVVSMVRACLYNFLCEMAESHEVHTFVPLFVENEGDAPHLQSDIRCWETFGFGWNPDNTSTMLVSDHRLTVPATRVAQR